jgi:anti-sigma regulatory factor (Ser/Thr protein kinase)
MPGTVCDGDGPARVPESRAEWALPAEPASVGTIRAGVRAFADAHGADEGLVVDLALAVTEGN